MKHSTPARLEDPLLYHHVSRCDTVNFNAYLVALAAWQRGLRVVFHYEVATHCERFARLAVQGYRGELFSVSDGQTTHYFCRAQGDLTSREASARCEDKQATKDVLSEHGIDVPAGCVVDARAHAAAQAFMQRHTHKRFLLKPLSGTLGKGVYRQLLADEVLTLLPTLQGVHLLEEHVERPEYRVYSVGGRCVAGLQRVPAHVMGDGQQTVAALIDQKQQQRARHPVYRNTPLPNQADISAFLKANRQYMHDVPALGDRVWLADIASFAHGGDLLDATQSLSPRIAATAVRTQQALGLPAAGIDLIVQFPGQTNERVVVLEANQNPHIYPDSLPFPGVHPGGGNRIAEAIIDDYFPATLTSPRFQKASFDLKAICQALQSGTVEAVSLPRIDKTWRHQRIKLSASQVNENTRTQLQRLFFTLGVNAQALPDEKGHLLVDIVAPKARLQLFMRYLQGAK